MAMPRYDCNVNFWPRLISYEKGRRFVNRLRDLYMLPQSFFFFFKKHFN